MIIYIRSGTFGHVGNYKFFFKGFVLLPTFGKLHWLTHLNCHSETHNTGLQIQMLANSNENNEKSGK